MADLSEILKAQGVEDDKIKAILDGMKTNKIFTSGEENLDIRYGKLKTDFDTKVKESDEAQKLIDEMKKSTQGNEDLQGKISTYEKQLADAQAENAKLKIDSAIKLELLANKAKPTDIDYLMFKIKQDNPDIKVDSDGKIKGIDVSTIKTTYSTNFEVDSRKKIDPNKLPAGDDDKGTVTKEQFSKMGYLERNKLHADNPELYEQLKDN